MERRPNQEEEEFNYTPPCEDEDDIEDVKQRPNDTLAKLRSARGVGSSRLESPRVTGQGSMAPPTPAAASVGRRMLKLDYRQEEVDQYEPSTCTFNRDTPWNRYSKDTVHGTPRTPPRRNPPGWGQLDVVAPPTARQLFTSDGHERPNAGELVRAHAEYSEGLRKKIRSEFDSLVAKQGNFPDLVGPGPYYPTVQPSATITQPPSDEETEAEAAAIVEEPDENSYMRRFPGRRRPVSESDEDSDDLAIPSTSQGLPAQSPGSVNETVRVPGVDHPVHHTVQVGANGNRHDQLQVKIVSGDGKKTETVSVDHVTGPGVDKTVATTTEVTSRFAENKKRKRELLDQCWGILEQSRVEGLEFDRRHDEREVSMQATRERGEAARKRRRFAEQRIADIDRRQRERMAARMTPSKIRMDGSPTAEDDERHRKYKRYQELKRASTAQEPPSPTRHHADCDPHAFAPEVQARRCHVEPMFIRRRGRRPGGLEHDDLVLVPIEETEEGPVYKVTRASPYC